MSSINEGTASGPLVRYSGPTLSSQPWKTRPRAPLAGCDENQLSAPPQRRPPRRYSGRDLKRWVSLEGGPTALCLISPTLPALGLPWPAAVRTNWARRPSGAR